eukprot:Hpha_TRINITY_DN33842_c0_g1::TRINITY_DN33842_c0_g1_i1::g.27465::m.27465/K00889/PIP5K; 1-phosphatidylinositol-4-phosphate 5-kinase
MAGLGLAPDEEVELIRKYLQLDESCGYFGSANCVLAAEVGVSVNAPGCLHLFAAMVCFVGDEQFTVDTGVEGEGDSPRLAAGQELRAKLLRELHLDELQRPDIDRSGSALLLSAARGGDWVFTGMSSPRQICSIIDVLQRRRKAAGLTSYEEALWKRWLFDADTDALVSELLHPAEVGMLNVTFQLPTVHTSNNKEAVERLRGAWHVPRLRYRKEGARQKKSMSDCAITLTTNTLCVTAQGKQSCIRGVNDLERCWKLDQIVAVIENAEDLRIRVEWDEVAKKGESKQRYGELTIPSESHCFQEEGSLVRTVSDAWYRECANRAAVLRGVAEPESPEVLAFLSGGSTSGPDARNVPIDVLRRLAQHFVTIGCGGDGFVSREDFRKTFGPLLMSKSFADRYFNVFRRSHDAHINFIEFLAGMTDMLLGTPEEKLGLSFRLFDLDQDGRLDENEFVAALVQLNRVSTASLPHGESVESFARAQFGKLASKKAPDAPPTISLSEYQRGMMTNADLHKAFSALGDLAVDWKAQKPQGGNIGGVAAQAKAKAAKLVLFGHKDWALTSTILHGINHAARTAERERPKDRLDEWLSRGGARAWNPTREEMHWLHEQVAQNARFTSLGKDESEQPEQPEKTGCFGILRRDFLFQDYAPQVFRALRECAGISTVEYVNSLGMDNLVFNLLLGSITSLRQMSSSGQSGSFFFVSNDGKYILKSLPREELDALRKILPSYALHLARHPDTLLTRFYGLYSLRMPDRGGVVTFVAMTNVFNLPHGRSIKQLYDLKGSVLKRSVGQQQRRDNVSLKDLDLTRRVHLRWDWQESFLQQVRTDADFLAENNIIDYSLLLGVDSEKMIPESRPPNTTLAMRALRELKYVSKLSHHIRARRCCRGVERQKTPTEPSHLPQGHAPYGGEAKEGEGGGQKLCGERERLFGRHYGGMPSMDPSETAYVGVIDILTVYGLRKKMEHRLKRLTAARMHMSCVPPDQYRERFVNFLSQVFVTQEKEERDVRLAAHLRHLQFRAHSEASVPVRLVLAAAGYRCGEPALIVLTPVVSGVTSSHEEMLTVREEYPLRSLSFGRPLSLLANQTLVVAPRPGSNAIQAPVRYTLEGGVMSRHQLLSAAATWCSGTLGSAATATLSVVYADALQLNRTAVDEIQERVNSRAADLVVVVLFNRKAGPQKDSLNPLKALAAGYDLVEETSSAAVCVSVLLRAHLRGLVTESKVVSADDVPGAPVCVALMLQDTPLCFVASNALADSSAYADAFSFLSSSLNLGARMDLVTLFSFVFWVTAVDSVQTLEARSKTIQELWNSDPFNQQRQRGEIFAGFSEPMPSWKPKSGSRRAGADGRLRALNTSAGIIGAESISPLNRGPASPAVSDQQGTQVQWPLRVLWSCPRSPRQGEPVSAVEHSVLHRDDPHSTPAVHTHLKIKLCNTGAAAIAAARRPERSKLVLTELSFSSSVQLPADKLHIFALSSFVDASDQTDDLLPSPANEWTWKEGLSLSPPGIEEIRSFLEKRVVVLQIRSARELSRADTGCNSGVELERATTIVGQGVLPLAGLCDGGVHGFSMRLLSHGLDVGQLKGNLQLLTPRADVSELNITYGGGSRFLS